MLDDTDKEQSHIRAAVIASQNNGRA